MGDVLGRQVVMTTSRDGDVLSLGKLQERDRDGVDFVVHSETPRLWTMQKTEQIFCYRVSNEVSGREKLVIARLNQPGGGTWKPLRYNSRVTWDGAKLVGT